MSATTQPLEAGAILARLDRLPATRHIWGMVAILSLGGMFEFYDLFFTGYVIPGLLRAHLLQGIGVSLWEGPALFVAATFAGLYIGTLVLGYVADRYGRRAIFTWSMVWYSVATIVMAFMQTGGWVCFWRLIAGIGIGVELVTIDAYLSELMPKNIRGKAFAFNQAIQFVIVPVVALISYLLVPISPFGIDGWRWVVALGSLGAVAVLILRRNIPESPRWLIGHGRLDEADRITAAIEARVRADLGGADLPPPEPHDVELIVNKGSFGEVWAPPYLNRTLMLVVFQFFQTFGYYGFQSWVPTLIAQKGIDISHSLLYSFIIAIANPFGPLIASTFADKIERKWQLTAAILCVGLFVVLFGQQSSVPLLIFFGIMTALSNNVMSYSFHAYQSELFPTRIRARAVGFTYSFSRLSTVFASFIIGASLKEGGVSGVYLLICGAMIISAVAIAGFGPRTRDMQLEQISH